MGLDLYFWKIRKEIFNEESFASSDDVLNIIFPEPENVKKATRAWFKQYADLVLTRSTYENPSKLDFIVSPEESDYLPGNKIGNYRWLYPLILDGTSSNGINDLPDFVDQYDSQCIKVYDTEVNEWLYFRKANHIHGWFVHNLQKNIDNCYAYKITPDIIDKLLNELETTFKYPKLAFHYFPIVIGFFFGHFTYEDPYYMNCLKKLYDSFKELKESSWYNTEYNIYYKGSW